jgi:pentatricopeptide repeat protein
MRISLCAGEGIAPSIVTFNTLLGAYASQGMHTEALKVFGLIVKAGFEPDVVSYSSLLNAFGKSGHPEKAQEVLELMKKRSRRPNLVTFNGLVDAYAAAGKYEQARELLHDMAEARIEPNVVTICSLFAACARGRCPEKVKDVFHEAKIRGILLNTPAYNAAITAYVEAGQLAEAMTLLEVMEEERVLPNGVTFLQLIRAAGSLGDYREAKILYDRMIGLGIPLTVEPCSALVNAFAKHVRPLLTYEICLQLRITK